MALLQYLLNEKTKPIYVWNDEKINLQFIRLLLPSAAKRFLKYVERYCIDGCE